MTKKRETIKLSGKPFAVALEDSRPISADSELVKAVLLRDPKPMDVGEINARAMTETPIDKIPARFRKPEDIEVAKAFEAKIKAANASANRVYVVYLLGAKHPPIGVYASDAEAQEVMQGLDEKLKAKASVQAFVVGDPPILP